MNLPFFIAKRITFNSKRTFSKLIVRIAILGIMLGLAVMILAVAIVKGFKTEIREKVRGFSGDIQISKLNLNSSYENTPFSMSDTEYSKISKSKGISFIQPFATKPGIINAGDEAEGVVLKGVDKNYNSQYFENILVDGRFIDFSDSTKSKSQILISKYTADRLNLKVGDDFLMYFIENSLRKRKFEIVGIYNLGVEEVDKVFVIGDLNLIRSLNNWENNQVGGYELRVDNFDNLEQIEAQVYDELSVDLKSYSVKQYYPAIFEWLSLLDVNTEVILFLMIVVAVINMISALLIMILERTNMIGILKALGSSNWNIRKIFLYNASYLIGIGLLSGNILGIGLGIFQQETHFFTLDQASYYMSFVPVQLNIRDIILLNAGTLVISLLVLLIPSLLVSRISPLKAIRFK
ncbi:ABC transporter permease [Daejeonella sp.]|uniref:ABC transporter permease n=1 Tax=Daejeonella sp. TaxID=2805397 RepID=UPI0037C1A8CA